MSSKTKDFAHELSLIRILHENVRWSNTLIDSPMDFSLLERRMMDLLTREVKRKFIDFDLAVPEKWKDLVFMLDDTDLAAIGGKKNVPRTYETLCALVGKVFTVHYWNQDKREIEAKIHWIDSFYYDKALDRYAVRVSPDIMVYLVNLFRGFSTFDVGTALCLKSKYTQRMYEICCKYSGDFRQYDKEELKLGNTFKKRVAWFSMDDFRRLFNLNEVRDSRTGKIVTPAIYKSYADIRRNILNTAQDELYTLYTYGVSDVWFDYAIDTIEGSGSRVSSILIFVYTREHPKQGVQRPWQKGDPPLFQFETDNKVIKKKTASEKLMNNVWHGTDNQETVVCQMLSRYLTKQEVRYYMLIINREAVKSKDTYTQVIQVLQEKEGQPKFTQGTKQYKRNNIKNYALAENLKVFGWSIPPPLQKTDKKKEQILFAR